MDEQVIYIYEPHLELDNARINAPGVLFSDSDFSLYGIKPFRIMTRTDPVIFVASIEDDEAGYSLKKQRDEAKVFYYGFLSPRDKTFWWQYRTDDVNAMKNCAAINAYMPESLFEFITGI